MKQLTVRQFFELYPDDDTCLDHIMTVRYGKQHECSNCKRMASFYKLQNRKAYSCEWCGSHVYPCAGTLFEASRTPLQLWFYAIYLFSTSRNGVAATEMQRQLGVTYKCAWRLVHQIRKHMGDVDGDDGLSGHVEVDETVIGGRRKGPRGGAALGKTMVFGMLERDGDVMTKVVPNSKRVTLQPIIKENVEQVSEISSDELLTYNTLKDEGYKHGTVKHKYKEYAKGETHVNTLEGYWAQLKRGITGTHIHVSKKHLQPYLSEFEYRFNARNHPDQMFP